MSLCALVFIKVTLRLEGNATGGAGIRSLSCVATEMFLKHAGLQTVLAAVWANMLPNRLRSGRGCWSH